MTARLGYRLRCRFPPQTRVIVRAVSHAEGTRILLLGPYFVFPLPFSHAGLARSLFRASSVERVLYTLKKKK